jgi:hypothetical protein
MSGANASASMKGISHNRFKRSSTEVLMSRNASAKGRRPGSRKFVIGVSIGIAALVAALIAAKPGMWSTAAPVAEAATSPAPASAGALLAPNPDYNFGSVSMAAGKVKHRYAFTNTGASPVMIERIYTSCMCTTATFIKGPRVVGTYGMPGHGPVPAVNQTLVAGETAYIDAVFDPAAHGPAGLGHTVREVTVEQAAGEPLRLGFTADVRP